MRVQWISSFVDDLEIGGVRMGTWLLLLACSGDPTACNTVLGPSQEIRFGSEVRCMVEGDSIVRGAARTNIGDKVVITYSCRPYTEEDALRAAKKAN
jgi:hypothetical protein